jgi:hypothetical protein
MKSQKAITKVKGYCAPKAAKLPVAQLFRERTTRAIGGIAQAKILVNLE